MSIMLSCHGVIEKTEASAATPEIKGVGVKPNEIYLTYHSQNLENNYLIVS